MAIIHRYTSLAAPVADRVGSTQWNDAHVLSISETEVNFGSNPVDSGHFTVVDANISVTSKIFICGSGNAATSQTEDAGEWDAVTFTAKAGDGSMTVYAKSDGLLSGYRKLYYLIGE